MSSVLNKVQQPLLELVEQMASLPPQDKVVLDELWKQINRLQAKSQVEVSHVQFKAGDSPLDEYVEVKNRGDLTIDISHWRINAGSPEQTFTWPEGSFLWPSESIKVHTKTGTGYSFKSTKPIWNNRGDIATLFESTGEPISTLAYGDKAHDAVLISHIQVDGKEHRTEGDEFVELTNISEHIVDLEGWRLESSRNDAVFVFETGVKLDPYACIKVYTNKPSLLANEYSFNSPRAIWNNQQGGCRLLDYQDREVSSYHY
ncbi:lamin tail domain-containing protein [Vibrio sp. JPW-9-11-11]|uniref:lamin tail domain-containing protein n=1 Tax=Vibrio sp. JPW-9-11-11 TaxID=1416532 RepID=UPI0015945EA1|nr:lamin tail domain-containing protein [Vibrio sp. JPW-9-11-11]NVD06506.1 lamin tail domain-containing protein [Vibrio sp. JPW-9-11-11]